MKRILPRTLQTVIIGLVVAGLLALALGGYFQKATDWFTGSLVDLQGWFSTRYMAVVDFVTAPRDLASLRQQNAALEAEVALLQSQIIDLEQQVLETEILSALVDFARANPENTYKAATVIGRDPSPFLYYVIINIGSNEGIRPGMPVVTEQGLVGQVDAVIGEAARVMMITDPASAVNVRLVDARTDAMLVGSLTGDMSLDMISQDVVIEPGDLILTSGLGGGYPADLLVGQVASIRKLDYELFQQASVQPAVNFVQMQYVLVITNFKPVDITPLAPTLVP
ncbi:MAG: rod shape-determining protein MreC [Chloroflexi bacterium]|nr:rod shape-determining protein MreC [Chloroflexota bacterium]